MRGHDMMTASFWTHGSAEVVRCCGISQASLWKGFSFNMCLSMWICTVGAALTPKEEKFV